MKAVSKTAYYCCGVRIQDAESAHPLIGDRYAKRLLGEEGMKYWEEFKQFKIPNAGNTVRAYIIDTIVKQNLIDHPASTIILIGAGLDSRAYRFESGSWIEIDETAVIDYKNTVLPVSECRNKLERIPIDFEKDKLADKLSPFRSSQNIIIIVEGVFLYLTNSQKNGLLESLTALFPKHMLICDLMDKEFFEKYGGAIHKKLVEHGTSFTDIMQYPTALFTQCGYRLASVISIVGKSKELGLIHTPDFILNYFMKKLKNGYTINTFIYHH